MTQQEVHDLIREHGGIVHGDGNIFFTNAVQFGLVVAAMSQEEALDKSCHMPPIGWRCTRSAGHDGPCAAVACPEDVEFVEKGMRRLREAGISDSQPSQEYAELPGFNEMMQIMHPHVPGTGVESVCEAMRKFADATHTLRTGGKP